MKTCTWSLLSFLLVTLAGCSNQKDTGKSNTTENRETSGKTLRTDRGRTRTTSPKDGKPTTTGQSNSTEVIQAGTADEYAKSYKANYGAATKKYEGKRIEITGVVAGVSIYDDEVLFTLAVPKGTSDPIRCRDAKDWRKVGPGQTVKLRATTSDVLPAVEFKNVEVLDVTGTAPTFTAESLREEFAKDENGIKKKFEDAYLFISGEVIDIKPDGTFWNVSLKTSKAESPVVVNVTDFIKKDMQSLKPGQKLRVLGKGPYRLSSSAITVSQCIAFEVTP